MCPIVPMMVDSSILKSGTHYCDDPDFFIFTSHWDPFKIRI